MEEQFEKLGQLIDEIESVSAALSLPVPPAMHVQQLRSILPKKVIALKECYVEITGENPWE